MSPAVIYVLSMIVFTSDGPAPITKMYDSAFNCQVAEGAMLTKARDAKDIVGWSVIYDCKPVRENNKV